MSPNKMRKEAAKYFEVRNFHEHGIPTAAMRLDSPQDIPALMAEIRADIRSECMDEITVELLRYAMPQVDRAATRGVPDWYEARLLESQFASEDKAAA